MMSLSYRFGILCFALLLLSSCNTDIVEDEVPCPLDSFRLLAKDNPIGTDIEFVYHQDCHSYIGSYLNWIESADSLSFIPTFEVNGGTAYMNNMQLVSGQSHINFQKDITIEVRNNTNIEKYRVSLICPQINSELPLIHIHCKPDSIKSKEDYILVGVDLYNPDYMNCIWTSQLKEECKIRGRGNSSWELPKKPYRIKFPEKISPFGLSHTKAKDWVLLAHDMDKSLLRNHLAFSVARALFNEDDYKELSYKVFTPSSTFVNVYFNDDYYGVYQFTDQVEKGEGRVDVETLGQKQGEDHSMITGGHLLEMVYRVDDYSINFTTARGIRIDHKYPKKDDHSNAQYLYIENFINEAEQVLYSDAFKDKNVGWRKYYDEKTLVDYIIVKEFIGDMDGYIGTRLFKKRSYDKLCFGPVWDMDKAWGNDIRVPFPDYPPISSLMIFGGFRCPGNSSYDWFMRLWEDESLRRAVAVRWTSKREELINIVSSQIDKCQALMPKSIMANFEVWPFSIQECQDASLPQKNYETELKHIRELTVQRANLLDVLFNQ